MVAQCSHEGLNFFIIYSFLLSWMRSIGSLCPSLQPVFQIDPSAIRVLCANDTGAYISTKTSPLCDKSVGNVRWSKLWNMNLQMKAMELFFFLNYSLFCFVARCCFLWNNFVTFISISIFCISRQWMRMSFKSRLFRFLFIKYDFSYF